MTPEPSTAVTEQPVAANPGEFTGKVIKVVDGDTVDVLTGDKETIRIRLNGIDCPERVQPLRSDENIVERFVELAEEQPEVAKRILLSSVSGLGWPRCFIV